jgi:23S rRNA (cytosine1962-C5)-methyltransferase
MISAPSWLRDSLLAEFDAQQTNVHRVYADKTFWIERYADDFLISYQKDSDLAFCREGLETWCRQQQRPARRIFGRHLPVKSEERKPPVLLQGDPALSPLSQVMENSVRYGVDFSAGYSTGFFLDQRANRLQLKKIKCRQLLNCFSYTCSFSVVAALGGAETVSLDLSAKSLARGRENFELNGLDPAPHRFLAEDVFHGIPYLERKGRRFDAIILDPPTFSRGKDGKAFQANRDFENLIQLALSVAAPKARLLLSTNSIKLSVEDLKKMGRFCAKILRTTAVFQDLPPLPDLQDSFSAKSTWMTLQ